MTVLMFACEKGYDAVVKDLIDKGNVDNVDKVDDNGWTALIYACQMDHDVVVKDVIEGRQC